MSGQGGTPWVIAMVVCGVGSGILGSHLGLFWEGLSFYTLGVATGVAMFRARGAYELDGEVGPDA